MRGITLTERAQLCDDSLTEAADHEVEIWERLRAQGRVKIIPFDDEFERWVATGLGCLALRVCPVDE